MARPPQHQVHKNVKRGPGVATFRTKLLDFSQVLHINCLNLDQEAPGPEPFIVS